MESIASGLVAALNAINKYKELDNNEAETILLHNKTNMSKEDSNLETKNKLLDCETKEGKTSKTIFPEETMIGALSKYIATPNSNFQPMNANFGILPSLDERIKDKKLRYAKLSDRAIEKLSRMLQ